MVVDSLSLEPMAYSGFGEHLCVSSKRFGFPVDAFGAMVLVLMQGYTFYERGGAIQKILTSKQSVANAKAATMIDILLGTIYLVFKEWSNMPMSTTWVFLGLLAGRELAFSGTSQLNWAC